MIVVIDYFVSHVFLALVFGATFFAAQWLDLLWPLLLITGTEHVALATDPAAPIPLSFTDYPLSHSLLAVFGWSLLIAALYWLFTKNKKDLFLDL